MKNIPSFIFLAFLQFIFFSCGSKVETQAVKLRIVSAAQFSQVPNSGGVLIVGRTLDDKNSFSKAIVSDLDSIELPKGIWEFFAIAWEGNPNAGINKSLTGVHRCAYSGNVQIDKEEAAVSFNLSQANCSLPISDGSYVADPMMMISNQFKSLNFADCSILPTVLSASSCSSTDMGKSKSFRIRIPDIVETNNEKKVIGKGLLSRCIEESQYFSSSNYLTLPVGTGENGFVNFTIESFDQAGCTGTQVISSYNHNSSGTFQAKLFDNGSSAYIYFPHFNPYASLDYDDTSYGSVVSFDVCHVLNLKLKNSSGSLIAADQALTVNVSLSTKALIYSDSNCSLGNGVSSSSFTIPSGSSSIPIYFKSFGSSLTLSANIYSLGIGFTYSKSVNTSAYNYAGLTVTQIKSIAEAAEGNSSISNAHTVLSSGKTLVIRYDNVIAKIYIISIDASSINFNFNSYDYTTGSTLTVGSSIFLDTAFDEMCDLTNTTCNIASYTGSDIGYHFIYNSSNFLNVYLSGPNRSIFYLQ